MMNEHGKSDRPIVPGKSPNKIRTPMATLNKDLKFTALLHHIYRIDTLRFAYSQLKRHAAAGVDDETWQHYGEDLEANLQDLSHRLKRGAYLAKPVRRV
jgi:RNA-directed DNA polymerase